MIFHFGQSCGDQASIARAKVIRNLWIPVLFVSILIIYAQHAWASTSDDAQFRTQFLVEEVVEESFPELEGVRIESRLFSSDDSFFMANVRGPTLFNEARNRTYIIYTNPDVYFDPPSLDALKAVLAHELAHVLGYTERNLLEMIALGIRYSTSPAFVTRYERETDIETLKKGYAEGLKKFRLWLYDHVSEEVEQIKRRDYLTPEEIDRWVSENP